MVKHAPSRVLPHRANPQHRPEEKHDMGEEDHSKNSAPGICRRLTILHIHLKKSYALEVKGMAGVKDLIQILGVSPQGHADAPGMHISYNLGPFTRPCLASSPQLHPKGCLPAHGLNSDFDLVW